MKYLAALAAVVLPAAAQAVTQTPAQGEFVYECQITETCKASGCTPLDPVQLVTLKRVDGQSKGVLVVDGQEHEVLVYPSLGAQEFLQVLTGGSVGYTVDSDSGELAIRASGAKQRNERGTCSMPH
ncbi:hypothetical protein [Ruegeria lacuscaerulensis]|uniref:hypothetical protein n=1 Tax=Ruegeria lacuscaerulensis TaxID=55218 RepID=UPI001480BF75|nr:hypothetical protein [Ruegeria lacuscaerulensis]